MPKEIEAEYTGLAYGCVVCVEGALDSEEYYETRAEAQERADEIIHEFAEVADTDNPEWDIYVGEVVVFEDGIEGSQYETDHRPYASNRKE